MRLKIVMGSLDSFKGEAVWEEETHPPNSPCRFQDERHQPRGVSWYPGQLEFGLLEAAAFEMTADPGSTFWPSHLFSIPTPWQVDSNPWAQIKSSFSSFSVQFSRSVMSDSLWTHELQHIRPPCPSPTPGVYSNSCPSSRWCHLAISSSVIPFSTCP